MLARFFNFALMLLSSIPSSGRASPLSLSMPPKAEQLLSPDLLILEDPTGTLSYQDVALLSDAAFFRSPHKVPNFSFTNSAYWVRMQIHNDSQLSYPAVLEYSYASTNFVDFYWMSPQNSLRSIRTGDQLPNATRSIRYRLPVFPIELSPGLHTIHLRVQTDGVVQVPLTLYTKESFENKKLMETSLLYAIYGAMFAIVGYNLLLFISTRKLMVFYYVLFVGINTTTYPAQQGLTNFLFPEADLSWFNNSGQMMLCGLSAFFSLQFIRLFLEIPLFSIKQLRNSSGQARRNQIPSLILCFFSVLSILQSLISLVSYNLGAKLMTLLLFGIFLYVLILSSYRAIKGDRLAGLFLGAWSLFIVGGLVLVATYLAVIPVTLYSQFSISFGLVFENIFLSLAIGYRLRKELSEALKENISINAQLVEKERLRTQFFHNVSHELRTPLNGIIGFLELVREGSFGSISSDAKTHVTKALRLAEAQKSQVNTILDLAKAKRGELTLRIQDVSLHDIKVETDHLAEGLSFQTHSASYHSELSGLDRGFLGDKEKLLTIIRNLIGNAFKFHALDRPNHVRLDLIHSEQNLKIIVSDSGIGIPNSHRQRIFEEYGQIEGDARRSYEGTGLGLSMVHRLVELMRGTITLDTHLGKGSCFTVEIPCASREELHLTSDSVAIEEPSPMVHLTVDDSPLTVTPHSQEGARWDIYIIDDHATNCEIMEGLLLAEGYHVRHALSGQAGLAEMRLKRPDLLLLDMMMPEMSGADVLAAMRSDPLLEEIPVILVTARASDEDRIEGLRLGADDYLPKPVYAAELRLRVFNMIQRHRLLRDTERSTQEDKLLQLGSLFGDLSHELKNILQGTATAQSLDEFDSGMALVPVQLSEREHQTLAKALVSRETAEGYLQRLSWLQDLAATPLELTVIQQLAELKLTREVLLAIWVDLKQQPEEALTFASTQFKIFLQHRSLLAQMDRCWDLTQGVLGYSRGESAQTCSVDHIWNHVRPILNSRLRSHQIRVSSELSSEKLAIDSSHLMQVLINLYGNAIDYVADLAPEERWIHLRSWSAEDWIWIEISNGGPPIPSEIHAHIFQRGYSTKGQQGNGLGLYVSRRLVVEAGGELVYEEGSPHPRFSLKLLASRSLLDKKPA